MSPHAPRDLARQVVGRRVTITWTPTLRTTGYQIEAGSSSGIANLAVLRSTAASLVVENVPAGTYFVRVRAVDEAGVSAPSNEVQIVVP